MKTSLPVERSQLLDKPPPSDEFASGKELGEQCINFARVYMKDACPDESPWFHHLLLWWFFSDWERCCAAAPRGHAKSTMVTKVAIIFCIAFRLHKNMMIISSTIDQANEHLSAVKAELETNEQLCSDFGIDVKTALKWNQDSIVLRLSDGFSFKLSAKSAGSSMRGTKYNNSRPSLVVLDDIEDEENTATPDSRSKLRKWLMAVVIPAMAAKGARLRFIGTVMHQDALLLMALKSASWHKLFFKAHDKLFKLMLWPDMFSKKKLKALYEEFCNMGTPHLYAQEYLNEIVDEEGRYFDLKGWQRVDEIDGTPEYWTTCDLAISKERTADYSVIMTFAVTKEGVFVVDIKRGRWDSTEIADNLIETQRQLNPIMMSFEKGTIEQSIMPFVELEEQRTGVYIQKEYLVSVKDKKTRARSFQGMVRKKMFFVLNGVKNAKYLRDEMKHFPNARHDDCVDCGAMVCMKAHERVRPLNAEEVKEVAKRADHRMYERMQAAVDDDWGF